MNRKTCLVLLALALPLLLACFLTTCGGPQEYCEEGHDPPNTHQMRICTNKKDYDFGEAVYITFTVTNISDQPLTLNGGDKAAIDVRMGGGYWSSEQELTPELTQVTLEPGESRTITWFWPLSEADLEGLRQLPFGVRGAMSVNVDGIVRPFPGVHRTVGVIIGNTAKLTLWNPRFGLSAQRG